MKLHLVSDIHLEFGGLQLPGGADLLVVAGDLCEARSFFRNDSNAWRRAGAEMRRFVNDEFAKYPRVVYVPGNHEYYGGSIAGTDDKLRLLTPTFLQGMSVDIDDYRLFGTTLWTDANRNSPMTLNVLQRLMSDFRVIDEFPVIRMTLLHQQQLTGLKTFLAENSNRKTVVVTHHAPSHRSVNEKYADDQYMNGGYFSDLDMLIADNPQIALWCHGHMHDPSDYTIGDTHVVCHPRGYLGYEPGARNYKPLEIDLP